MGERVHLDLATSVQLIPTGRMGPDVADMAEITFSCPDCDHNETILVDVVSTFAMMALHRGRSHAGQDTAKTPPGLVDRAGQPLNRRDRRHRHNGST